MKLPGWLGSTDGESDPGEAPARPRRAEQAGEDPAKRSPQRPPRRTATPSTGSGDPARRPRAATGGGSRRAGATKALGSLGSALKQGAGDTRGRSKGVPSRLGKQLLNAGGVGFGIFFDLLGFVLNLLLAVVAWVAGPLRRVAGALRRAAHAASRALTPTRALTVVVAGAAVLLALSQFADYRGISIGTDAYTEVATVAPAPERERSETGSAHGYAMVPVAIVALVLLLGAVSGRRWQLCRLIALGGVAAVVVALLIDRPAGQDPGEAAVAYQGVRASLLGGFYAQLFAGALLAASAMLLGRELRLAAAGSPARSGPRRPRERGGRGVLRRTTKPEGARA